MERSAARKEFLNDIFVAAIEGGINYWASVSDYEHLDLDTFGADVRDNEDDDAPTYRVDAAVIARGVSRISTAKAPFYEPNKAPYTQCEKVKYLSEYVAKIVRDAGFENDASEIDADVADVVVQVGLFGEVVYG